MKTPFTYDPKLYNNRSAMVLLPWLLNHIPVNSIVDIGCGIGNWLSAASQLGVKNVFGYDVTPYNPGIFCISETNYKQVDILDTQKITGSYELCICLEVAEHLPEQAADSLMEVLTGVSDRVLFSAAIPGQPGQGHINCQWPDYWQQKFQSNGYEAFDIIRPEFWDNGDIEWWYRQNMVLYAKRGTVTNFSPCNGPVKSFPHPELYSLHCTVMDDLQELNEQHVFYPSLSFAVSALVKSMVVTPFKKRKS